MSYPASFEVDYAERRSRLTALFRLILAIPVAIWLYLYGILAYIAIVIAWFAIVITGGYPRALFDFVAGFNRALARGTAYAALLCDPYPPFSGAHDAAYPVRMEFAGPLERYSRLKTLVRLLLAIPILILRYAMNILLEIGAFAAWVVIVITGKLPARVVRRDGPHELLHGPLGRVSVPADRDLPAVSGRADASGWIHTGVTALRLAGQSRCLPAACANRRTSSPRSSSGSITASITSSEARCRMSMSCAYSSRSCSVYAARSASPSISWIWL